MEQNLAIRQVREVKARHEKALLKLANVVGLGVGFKEIKNTTTTQIALIVNVTEKKALIDLAAKDIIPPQLDDIVTDVQEVGHIKAYGHS